MKIGTLSNRPLYGSAGAPLRWYITIARALEKAWYSVLNSDRCVFANHIIANPTSHSLVTHGKLIGAAILTHADDIISAGHFRERKNFESCVNFFLHGEMGELTAETALAFCGVEAKLPPVPPYYSATEGILSANSGVATDSPCQRK